MKPTFAIAAVAAVGLAGCGTVTFDQEDLQTSVSTALEQEVGVAPESVSCPDDAPREQGEEFQCTGTAPNGDEFTIDITVTGDDGQFELFVPPQQFER